MASPPSVKRDVLWPHDPYWKPIGPCGTRYRANVPSKAVSTVSSTDPNASSIDVSSSKVVPPISSIRVKPSPKAHPPICHLSPEQLDKLFSPGHGHPFPTPPCNRKGLIKRTSTIVPPDPSSSVSLHNGYNWSAKCSGENENWNVVNTDGFKQAPPFVKIRFYHSLHSPKVVRKTKAKSKPIFKSLKRVVFIPIQRLAALFARASYQGPEPFKPVVVVPYNSQWPANFRNIRAELMDILQGVNYISIEHVGSTSVLGLSAKPCIDVDVIVNEGNIAPAIKAIRYAGYNLIGQNGFPGRWSLYPFDDEGTPERHVCVCLQGSLSLRCHLALRDTLRMDWALRNEYGRLKEDLAARKMDVEEYTFAKTDMVIKILERVGMAQKDREEIRKMNTQNKGFCTGLDKML